MENGNCGARAPNLATPQIWRDRSALPCGGRRSHQQSVQLVAQWRAGDRDDSPGVCPMVADERAIIRVGEHGPGARAETSLGNPPYEQMSSQLERVVRLQLPLLQ